jgi:hypothetical protein
MVAVSVRIQELHADAERDCDAQRQAYPFPHVWLELFEAGKLEAQRIMLVRLLLGRFCFP